jgi:hypothetical protein
MWQACSLISRSVLVAGCTMAVVVSLPLSAQVPQKQNPPAKNRALDEHKSEEKSETARRKRMEELVPFGYGLPERYLKIIGELSRPDGDLFFRPDQPAEDPQKTDQPPDDFDLFIKKLDKLVSAKPVVTARVDDELRNILALRYAAAVSLFKAKLVYCQDGRVTDSAVIATVPLIRNAQIELSENAADALPILELCVEGAALRVRLEAAEYKLGRGTEIEVAIALHDHLDAQIRLLRVKKSLAKK